MSEYKEAYSIYLSTPIWKLLDTETCLINDKLFGPEIHSINNRRHATYEEFANEIEGAYPKLAFASKWLSPSVFAHIEADYIKKLISNKLDEAFARISELQQKNRLLSETVENIRSNYYFKNTGVRRRPFWRLLKILNKIGLFKINPYIRESHAICTHDL